MYTSGSTGNPKGVMISHKNLIAASKSFAPRIGSVTPGSQIWVSYLPLAHILELCAEIGSITSGIRIGYSSPQTLVDTSTGIKKGQKGDLRVLKPTIMAAVPLILERFRKAVNEKISKAGWLTQILFDKAYEQKVAAIQKGQKTFFLDRLIFKKISRAVLGGKCKSILCGASLLSENVQEFIQVCLAPTRQAYALTETCAGGTGQYEFENDTKIVGSPIIAAEIRLVDWQEGNYHVTDKPNPRGEIYIGGDSVTIGYYKNPEKTREDYHEIDGIRYFATGDIGEVLPNGNFKIIDRKKDLVKLQSGEYISLSKIEVIIKQLPFVENCCVYADPYKTFCVCLICPDVAKIVHYAKTLNFNDVNDFKSILANKELLKLIQKDIIEHCEKRESNYF
jgi:long-chain acyl-CoA synthetase